MISLTALEVSSLASYAIAVLLPALDALVPLLPSETAVIALGVASAGSADPRIAVLIALAAGGAFIGDNACYLLGRRFGPAISKWVFAGEGGARRRAWARRSEAAVLDARVPGFPPAVRLLNRLRLFPAIWDAMRSRAVTVGWYLVGQLPRPQPGEARTTTNAPLDSGRTQACRKVGGMSGRAAMLLLALVLCVLLTPLTGAYAQSQSVHGTLRAPDGTPVAGVTITATRSGAEIGKAITAKDGTWEIPLPRAGRYTINLDVATLPAGLNPAREGGQTLEAVPVPAGESRTVIFQLTRGTPAPATGPGGEREGGGESPRHAVVRWLDQFAQLLVEGIKFGSIIAITAVGLSLIFGTTGLINFAHGELVTLGATVAFVLNASLIGPQLQLIPATLVTVAIGAAFGGMLELGLWKPLRLRGIGRIQLFIVSIGLSLLIRHIILVLFGTRPQPYADYTIQQEWQWGPVSIAPRDLVITLLSLLVLASVALMLRRTRAGKAIRAVADNRDLAESSGIDVSRVILNVWLLAGGLAALGGVFFGLAQLVSWDMGFKLLLLMFAAVILGGLGTAYGVIAGSLVVGIVAQVSTIWFPVELQNAWALIVLIIVLLIRPQGIFGQRERVG